VQHTQKSRLRGGQTEPGSVPLYKTYALHTHIQTIYYYHFWFLLYQPTYPEPLQVWAKVTSGECWCRIFMDHKPFLLLN